MKAQVLIWINALILCSLSVVGQDVEELRAEREKYLEDIAFTEQLLNKKTSDKELELSQVRLLGKQIRSRENLINNIREELRVIQRNIRSNETEISVLQKELAELKEEYARLIYKAYQTRRSYNKIQYILASSDFNQAYKRVKYMQQYSKFRKKQAAVIKEKSLELDEKQEVLQKNRDRQELLLNERRKEVSSLNNRKRDQDRKVATLQQEEKNLRSELQQKQRARQRIEDEINRILQAAVKESGGGGGMALTPEMKIISSEFGKNRGRLPWPVERGVITSRFGKHRHEVLKKVEIDNKGVDMTTNPGEPVRTIFEGVVSNVISIKGANLTVIIQHGAYFSVYQDLVNIQVKKGDRVQGKQQIGESSGANRSGSSDIHFQIWKGADPVNPEIWLAR